MARNSELVRQWEILRDIDCARNGIAIPKLAAMRHVHQRTIRCDIDALCRAGFPLARSGEAGCGAMRPEGAQRQYEECISDWLRGSHFITRGAYNRGRRASSTTCRSSITSATIRVSGGTWRGTIQMWCAS